MPASGPSGHMQPTSNSRRYLDQARIGINSARAYSAAAWRIASWWLGTGLLVGVAIRVGHAPGAALRFLAVEVGIIAAGAAVLRSVSRTHGRPVRSVLSADGTLQPGRVLSGAAAWLAPFAALLGLSGEFGEGFRPYRPGAEVPVWIAALALVPLQAAAEEVLFRGYLTQSLGLIVRGRVLPTLLVSTLFALAHVGPAPWWTLLGPFAFGVAMSAVVLRDGRLEAAIGAHIAHNLLALSLNGPSPFADSPAHGDGLPPPAADAAQTLLVNASVGVAFYALTGGAGPLRGRARRPADP